MHLPWTSGFLHSETAWLDLLSSDHVSHGERESSWYEASWQERVTCQTSPDNEFITSERDRDIRTFLCMTYTTETFVFNIDSLFVHFFIHACSGWFQLFSLSVWEVRTNLLLVKNVKWYIIILALEFRSILNRTCPRVDLYLFWTNVLYGDLCRPIVVEIFNTEIALSVCCCLCDHLRVAPPERRNNGNVVNMVINTDSTACSWTL